jgi:dihydropteroate synthase
MRHSTIVVADDDPGSVTLLVGDAAFDFDGTTTAVMGVINVSPESRNRHTVAANPLEAGRMALGYASAGVDLIDLGAQSSHYEAGTLTPEEEWSRLGPALQAVLGAGLPVSVDTWKLEVARRAIAEGVGLVNDTGGLRHPAMVELLAETGIAGVAMRIDGPDPHRVRPLDTSGDGPGRIFGELAHRVESLRRSGVTNLAVDPGIAINYPGDYVAYTRLQLEVIRRLGELRRLGKPVLIPIPRKQALAATLGYVTLALEHGADMIRVHDVAEAVTLVTLFERRIS